MYPNHLLFNMGQSSSSLPSSKVFGYCNFDYLPVRNHFESMILHGYEDNAQLCVYVDGTCVVDLYGSSCNTKSYNAKSTQVSPKAKPGLKRNVEFFSNSS